MAVIPARSGSKGVPDKNIKPLADMPLLAYSIVAARLTRHIERVIVSTDSPQYAEIAREFGAEVPFLRPAEISGDTSTDYEFIKHILDWMTDQERYQPHFLVHLRPTTPLREVRYIESAIESMEQFESATALRSVQEMSESAYKMFDIEEGYLKQVGSESFDLDGANLPRQAYRKTFKANGYVDVLKTSFVLDHKKLHGHRAIAHLTPPIVEVDTMEDFRYLEYFVSKHPEITRKLFQSDPKKSLIERTDHGR